jgi:hypothetical protein
VKRTYEYIKCGKIHKRKRNAGQDRIGKADKTGYLRDVEREIEKKIRQRGKYDRKREREGNGIEKKKSERQQTVVGRRVGQT